MIKLIKLLLPILFLTFTIVEVNAQKTSKKTSILDKAKQKKKSKSPMVITPPPPIETEPVIAAENPVPYFVGAGNEPNWNIEMLQGMDGSFETKIMTNYGEQKYDTQLFKQIIKIDDSYQEVYTSKPTPKDKNSYDVQFVNEPCTDAAKINHEARIRLKINELTYNGCGDFAKNMPLELSGKFIVIAVNNIKTNKTSSVEIDVFRHTISANMGCNSMSGGFFAAKNEIKPILLAATRMACDDMKLEQDFGAAIRQVKSYESSDYGIFLLDVNKKRVLELKRL